jgi:CRISPR-associated protein Cas1
MNSFQQYTFPYFPESDNLSSIETMLAAEGAWAKQAYKLFSQKYNIKWSGKKNEDKNRNNPITFLNFLSYSIADVVIHHMGFDPNLGILHGRTKGGGLCYDLADVFKPVWSLAASFEYLQDGKDLNCIKQDFISKVIEFDLFDFLIKTLELTFNKGKL